MRFLSVCSGVEAASLAWEPLGWRPFAFSEIEPFPCAVLAARWPQVPNLGDMTRIEVKPNGDIEYYGRDDTTRTIPNDGRSIDLIVGGTPCQDASTAGKRAGLIEGERSKLAFTFTRLAYELAAYRGLRWLVWENVPGCFSLNRGADFAALLSSFVGRDIEQPAKGWGSFGIVPQTTAGNLGVAWRVLDSQYVRVDGFPHAVPQRRRRIFLVGYFGDWRRAAAVLFEPKSLLGDNPPQRNKGQAAAGCAENGAGMPEQGVAATIDANCYKGAGSRGGIERPFGFGKAGHAQHSGDPQGWTSAPIVKTLNVFSSPRSETRAEELICMHETQKVMTCRMREGCAGGGKGPLISEGRSLTLGTGNDQIVCIHGSQAPISAAASDAHHVPCVVGSLTCSDLTKGSTSNEAVNSGLLVIDMMGGKAGSHITDGDVSPTLTHGRGSANDVHALYDAPQRAGYVRRLTPTECERLMAMPDGHTIPAFGTISDALVERFIDIIYTWDTMTSKAPDKVKRRKASFVRRWLERISDPATCPDAPRYKACGNSFCANCVRWVGVRIEQQQQQPTEDQ